MGVVKLVVERAQAYGLIPRHPMVTVNETISLKDGKQLISWTDQRTGETYRTVMAPDPSMSSGPMPNLNMDDGAMEDPGASVRLEYTIPLAWGKLGIDCKDELECRALLLVRDRIKEFTTQEPHITLHQGNINVKLSVNLNTSHAISVKLAAVREEVKVLPQTGTAACPCGCGADLAIRECRRQRVAVKEGVVCLTPPAFTARNQAYPDHAEHGLLGWVVDPGTNGVVMVCMCGDVLRIPYKVAQSVWMNEAITPGGPAAEIITKAIQDHYAAARERPDGLVVNPYGGSRPLPSPYVKKLTKEQADMARAFQDQLDAQNYAYGMDTGMGAEEFKNALLGRVDENVPPGRAFMISQPHGDITSISKVKKP